MSIYSNLEYSKLECQDSSEMNMCQKKPSIYEPAYKAMIAFLVHERQIAAVSQKVMAKELKLKQPDISKIESCERRLDILECVNWIQVIAKYKKVSPIELWKKLYEDIH